MPKRSSQSRSFRGTTALSLMLMGSTALSPAWAQKGVVLAPASPWAISKIEGTGGSAGYCAMARRFRQSAILTVARNVNSESSIAIDFQAPRLRPDVPISIVLDPGAGEQRAYDIPPASAKAVIVRLGKDDAFFSALEKTGLLRAEIGGDAYNFSLSDIDAGRAKLNSCLASLEPSVPMSPAAPLDAAPVAAVRSENLHGQLASLRSDIETLKQENARLEKLAAGETPTPQDSEQAFSSRITSLENENADLRSLTAETRGEDIYSQSGTADANLVKALNEENRALRGLVDNGKQGAAEVEALRDNVATLEQENRTLRKAAENADVAAALAADNIRKNIEQEIAAVRQENESLKVELASRADESAKSTGEAVALLKKIGTLDQQNSELQKKLQDTEANNSSGLEDVTALAVQVEELRQQNEALQQKIASRTADDPASQGEFSEMSARLAFLEKDNTTLRSALEVARAEKDQENSELMVALSAENKSLRGDIAMLRTAMEQRGDLESKFVALQEENTQLRREVAVLQARNDTTAKALQAALDENRKLKDDIRTAAVSPQSMTAINEEVAALKAENRELTRKLTAAEKGLAFNTEALDPGASQKTEQQTAMVENVLPLTGDVSAIEGAFQVAWNDTASHASDAITVSAETLEPNAGEETTGEPIVRSTRTPAPAAVETTQSYEGLSEAQMMESHMRDGMNSRAPAPPLLDMPEPPAAPPEKPIEMRASQDPFEGMTQENGKPVAKAADKPVAKVVQKKSAEKTVKKSVEKPAEKSATKPAPILKSAPRSSFSIRDVIVSANLPGTGAPRSVAKGLSGGANAWQWESNGVYGSAEQASIGSDDEFAARIHEYLNKTESRCTGDFAVVPDRKAPVKNGRVESYEIACVGAGVNTAASVVFYYGEGQFSVIAHEAAAAQLSSAMDSRDRILTALK